MNEDTEDAERSSNSVEKRKADDEDGPDFGMMYEKKRKQKNTNIHAPPPTNYGKAKTTYSRTKRRCILLGGPCSVC